MKKLLIILCALLSASLIGCEEEDKTPTTIIEGKVVWYDTQEPIANLEVNVLGFEDNIGNIDPPIESYSVVTDVDGLFKFEISNYDSQVDYFGVGTNVLLTEIQATDEICYSECPRNNTGCKGQSECGNIQKGSNKFFTIEFLRDTE